MPDASLAALNAPYRRHHPHRYDPVPARTTEEDWVDIRAPRQPHFEWFERVAAQHLNGVLGVPVAKLAPPGTALVDVVVPGDRFAVAQVKSQALRGDQHTLADAFAGAHVPGSFIRSRHSFVYTESGYTGGTLATSEDQGQFLFTIDKRGFVRPWNAAARMLDDGAHRRTYVPSRGSGTMAELMVRSAADEESAAYEASVMLWLDSCAQTGYNERRLARQWVLDRVWQMWSEAGLPEHKLDGYAMAFVGYTLEEAELTGRGEAAALQLLDQVEVAVTVLARTPEQAAPGHPVWREALDGLKWAFARERLHTLADQGFFINEGEDMPPLLARMSQAAWGPGVKWQTPENVWREFLLAFDASRG